ncbi:MAG: hypothetical protein ACOY3E_13835 [Pseudomonadota bacterium]
MDTAALDGALLVFHPGSGATVALTGELQQVFCRLQQGLPAATADAWTDSVDQCLRLLRQQQLIMTPP